MYCLDKLFPVADSRKARNSIKFFGIFCIVFAGLISSAFVRIFNRFLYLAIMLCLAGVCYFCNRLIADKGNQKLTLSVRSVFRIDLRTPTKYLWLLLLGATAMGFVKGSWGMGNLIDLIVIGIGVFLILDAPDCLDGYKFVMGMIVVFALLYAVSIWLEVLFPEIYSGFTKLLTYGGAELRTLESYYTGFTTNPTHTAGYIAAGVFVCMINLPQKRITHILTLVFLLVTLLYTGVRMQVTVVYLLVGVMLFVFIPRDKWGRLCVIICIVGMLFLLAVKCFPEQLSTVPVFARLHTTVSHVQSEKNDDSKETELEITDNTETEKESVDSEKTDKENPSNVKTKLESISSGRMGLYQHAINLIKQNPVFGIGWGNFRESVPGNVTYAKKWDAHNIYLQVLCELGLIGFLCYCVPLLYTFIKTLKEFWKSIKDGRTTMETKLLGFSLQYQLFFYIVGITDNPLYHPYGQIPFLISCGILFAYLNSKPEMDSKATIENV